MNDAVGSSRFQDLPLFWKLLVPFVVLMLIVGAFGGFLIVRDLTTRARSSLNQSLLESSLTARAVLHDRELFLLESANLAANLEGMAGAVDAGDRSRTGRLLRTVLALKTNLNLVAATDGDGVALAEFRRREADTRLRRRQGRSWSRFGFVKRTLRAPGAQKRVGFVKLGNDRMLAIATPICSRLRGCGPVGTAIVGLRLDQLAAEAAPGSGLIAGGAAGLTIYDRDGRVLAAQGLTLGRRSDVELDSTGPLRRTERVDGAEVHTLYAPFRIEGERQGMVAVTLPAEPVFASVRSAGWRLVWILVAGLAGIVAIGALLSRLILRQVRALLETNQALARGELSARTPVMSRDEIGQVAEGLNTMAAELQASHETLETRVVERTAEVVERTAEVERLLRERTEFFASLSHELRTPLAIVLSEADMLLDTEGQSAETGRAIKRSAGQLLSSVNTILELAQAEAGGLEIELTEISLSEQLRELRPAIQRLADTAHLELSVDLPDDLPLVEADPARLHEIILNLVDNAVKYTPDGGRVTLSAELVDETIRVSVTDTGPGIPEGVRERIFEPFFRVKQNRPRVGRHSSGLGLALTKRLVEAHGGEIGIESHTNQGTTFTFSLVATRHPSGEMRTDAEGSAQAMHGSREG